MRDLTPNWPFLVVGVAMITLTHLVVEAQDAGSIDNIRQPIFEGMFRALNRLRHLPDGHLHKGSLIQGNALSQ